MGEMIATHEKCPGTSWKKKSSIENETKVKQALYHKILCPKTADCGEVEIAVVMTGKLELV